MEIPEIYLDAAATTPPLPQVVSCIQRMHCDAWANPSSLHRPGLIAAEALGRCRAQIATALHAEPDELIFTSGATESVHLALHGAAGNGPSGRVVISAVEHPSVEAAAQQLVRHGWTVEHWPVDGSGLLRLEELDRLLAPPTRLVSLIWGQSEVGAIQPIPTIGHACRERGVVLHTDATQLIPQGLISWSSLPVDLLSFSSHKLQGPRGVGVLLHRRGILKQSLLGGGGQEGGHRAGTEPVSLIAGLAQALTSIPQYDPDQNVSPPGAAPEIRPWRDRLQHELIRLDGVNVLLAQADERLPHHLACLVGDHQGNPINGRRLVRELARQGVACSSGSACRSGVVQDSPILTAMGIEQPWRQSLLRLTLGPWLTSDDLKPVPAHLKRAIQACG